MSVRIVDPNPDPSVVKFVICRRCGVKLSYVPKDVSSYTSYDYGGGSDVNFFINCAGCNERVSVRGY